MSFDCSRFSFQPWNDFFGVVMQQGRVQLDSDWNEWVAELSRRLQAGTMDTLGRAVVPRTTPEGFHILATGGQLSIGPGRIYVDGILAENHGATPLQWDPALAELEGTTALSFFAQPYLPFNATNQPAPADVFNRPALDGRPASRLSRRLAAGSDPLAVSRSGGEGRRRRYHHAAADRLAGEAAQQYRQRHLRHARWRGRRAGRR